MAGLWIILKIFIFLVGIILVLSVIQFFVSIHPPRFSSHNTPKDYGLEYENVSFVTSDRIKIKGWLLASEKAKGTVITGHGYPFDKGNILPVVKFLFPGYNMLLYDHRYFGESSGRITTAGAREVKDVEAAVDFVRKKFGKEEPIAFYGFSLSASAMLMARQEVKAVIADSAYADLENMIKQTYSIFGPLKFPFVKITDLLSIVFLGINPKKVSPALAVEKSGIPVFVIHGEKDSQIPVENAHALKAANPGIELWIVEGADHGQAHALEKEEYERRVKEFLGKHMG